MTAISSALPPLVQHGSARGPEIHEGPGPDRDHDGDESGASAIRSSAPPPAGTGALVDAIA